ncbi:tRNA (adenine(22)-N(1))-methyltransferase [Leuconostoc holzapfelii]|uniref:tRNA (Adenine-N(1))-methyltransferase n=1 Tax=Leuconostoc holzapfelii TaxID=434464 RepID=A0A846ZIF7_9LACO|nr:tRNA (adenine(22)-N(1))-methyltransferase TrmK [Leuconostoc holzapfelii]NKZ18683.1 tRNA (adenine-N(1))-methyltransferase [Leuconostoc holzapfelii]
MDSINLSPRLSAVASFVPKGARMADIGSDHAYLPAHLLLQSKINFAVVGEVAKGPLENARHELAKQRLTDVTVLRLADGLAAVTAADQIDTVTIAGMGGILIRDILAAAKARGQVFETLILQPNTDEAVVRQWLIANAYQLTHERIVQEDKHFYEIIVAKPGKQTLSSLDLTFGPFLRDEQSPVFKAKWQKEADRIALIFERMSAAGKDDTPAYHQWQARYQQIQEVLS